MGNVMILILLTTDGPAFLYFKRVVKFPVVCASLIQAFHKHLGKKTFFIKLLSSHLIPLVFLSCYYCLASGKERYGATLVVDEV